MREVVAKVRKRSKLLPRSKMMDFWQIFSAALEAKRNLRVGLKTPRRNGRICLQTKRRKEFKIFGARLDVTTIN